MRLLLLSAALSWTPASPYSQLPPELFSPLIPQKLLATAQLAQRTPTLYPEYTTRDAGAWLFFGADTWTSGFLPATFYALAERAAICPRSMNGMTSAQWLEIARSSVTGEIPLEVLTHVGHDVGFLSFPFVDELTVYAAATLQPLHPFLCFLNLTCFPTSNPYNETALHAVETFAAALAARFNPVVGCTRSWDTANPTDFQVIVDNMMTLDVLFSAADITGNDTLRQIAISHADKTMMNHIRADGAPSFLFYGATPLANLYRIIVPCR